jgi:hypothetical protein
MQKDANQTQFEVHFSQYFRDANFALIDGKYEDAITESAWVGWQLKDDLVQSIAVERRLSAPRTASPVECVLEAVRHVLKLTEFSDYKSHHGLSIAHTNAWGRLENAFLAIHSDLSVSFPALVDFQSMSLSTKRAFDLIFQPKNQQALSPEENDRLFAIFEYGLVFQSIYPELRNHLAPLSANGKFVFIDGLGNVPLDFSQVGSLPHDPDAPPLSFGYKNYRGEYGVRKAIPIRIYLGNTEFHHETQWLLEAFDLDKKANRVFAIQDITSFFVQTESR